MPPTPCPPAPIFVSTPTVQPNFISDPSRPPQCWEADVENKGISEESPLVWEGQAEKGIYEVFRRSTHFTPFPSLPAPLSFAHLGLGETA